MRTHNGLRAKRIEAQLGQAFAACALSLPAMVREAEEVVLFGSRAADCADDTSDFDLLLVGRGKRLKRGSLDVIWVRPRALRSPSWLGSELANHVAKFGIWLKGNGDWRNSVFASNASVVSKREKLLVRLSRLYVRRRSLRGDYLQAALVPVVLDLYRLDVLLKRQAVPPAPVLRQRAVADRFSLLSRVAEESFLGSPGACLVREVLMSAGGLHDSLQGLFAARYGSRW